MYWTEKEIFENVYSSDQKSLGWFCMTYVHLTELNRRHHGFYTTAQEGRKLTSVCYTLLDDSESIPTAWKKVIMKVSALNTQEIEVLKTKKEK